MNAQTRLTALLFAFVLVLAVTMTAFAELGNELEQQTNQHRWYFETIDRD